MPNALVPVAELVETETSIDVKVKWSGNVDRNDSFSWGLADTSWRSYNPRQWEHKRSLARRLVAAVNGGAVFSNPQLKVDVRGKTYVSADCSVYGKHMNATLSRLGY